MNPKVRITKKLLTLHSCDFIESIKDAPEDLAALDRELKAVDWVLKLISDAIERDEQRGGMDSVLDGCKEPLDALYQIVVEITQALGSKNMLRQQWMKMEWTWRAETIAKFERRLQRAKMNIMMTTVAQNANLW